MLLVKRLLILAFAALTSSLLINNYAARDACAQSRPLLHGSVLKEGNFEPAKSSSGSPSLSRKDIESAGDPFASPGDAFTGHVDEAFDAPQQAFQGAGIKPKPPFGLQAEKEGGGNFSGHSIPGIPDKTALLPQEATPQTFIPIEQDPALQAGLPQSPQIDDPDATPEMQLAWDEWHHRVAQAIFERFKFFADKAFRPNPMLVARLAYVVTADGRVGNVQFAQKSPNIMFNALIIQCIKSINGDKVLLQFPQGSRRVTVDQFGTFDMAGRGAFRYEVGDKETVPGTAPAGN